MKKTKKLYIEPKINVAKFECDEVATTSGGPQEFSQMQNYSSTQNFVKWNDVYGK